MTSELLPLLQHSTLVLSLALLAVLALRGAWLRCFGPGNIMLLWVSVPATLLALLVPAPVRRIEVDPFSTFAAETSAPLPTLPAALSEPAFTLSGSELLAAIWLAGTVLTASFLVLSQWRFRRSLGRLERRPDGSFRSESSDTGPALVGALRPRIVLPADFDRRYTAAQQFLIMKHERCHLKRGDAQFTLLACLLRSLFWFNPLVHLAWSRFRTDQELACDAAVLRAHPEARREYAEAMVSTHFKAPQLPVGCTWQTGNPLKRRITMLYTQSPGKLQILAGTVLALSASTAAAVGAWSSQEPQRLYTPAGAPQTAIATVMTSSFGSAPALPRLSKRSSPTGPGLASATLPTPEADAEPAPQIEAVAIAPPAPAAPEPQAPPSPSPHAERPPTPEAPPPPEAPEMVEVQAARLVEVSRPSFPRTGFKPELVSYPGMPEAEQPGPDWEPKGGIWRLELRVRLDENGEPVKTTIANNDLSSSGMVRRYERLALRAVRNWRYAPAQIDGEPVASEVLLAFHFDTRAARLHNVGKGPHESVNRWQDTRHQRFEESLRDW